ncbi:MAG: hypothetical protein GXP27_22425 [Planctomycetes bacterium]|nr:hypothetical protein [Planctomycetota bacterium]
MDYLMHIPTPLLFEHYRLKDLLDIYQRHTGETPSGIVFDVFSAAGPNFASKLYPRTDHADACLHLRQLADFCGKQSLGLWLCFNPSMPFAASNATHIIDSRGDSSRQCCINAPGTQELIELLAKELRTVITEGCAGLVLPCQDLWPMGARANMIEITCFCPYCVRFYLDRGLARMKEFGFYPSPLNLALKDTGTGIDHIHALNSSITAEELIEHSRAERMLAAEYLEDLRPYQTPTESAQWGRLRDMAEQLLRFVRARHELTVKSLETIAASLKNIFESCTLACLVEGSDYDWTAGFFLDQFVTCDWFDALWLPPSASVAFASRRELSNSYSKQLGLYCVQRSWYVVGEFASHLEAGHAAFRHATLAAEREHEAIRQTHRIGKMLASFVMADPGDYRALCVEPDSINSVVTPVFFQETINKLLESIPVPKSEVEELAEALRQQMG